MWARNPDAVCQGLWLGVSPKSPITGLDGATIVLKDWWEGEGSTCQLTAKVISNIHFLVDSCIKGLRFLLAVAQRTVWKFLKKLKIELQYDPTILLPGTHPEKMKFLL